MKKVKMRWLFYCLAVCLMLSSSGCTEDNSNDITSSSTAQSIDSSESSATADVPHEEDAPQQSGYYSCRLEGCDNEVLLILNGDSDTSREFVFYLKDGSELENVGSLDGNGITAYISNKTKCLSICKSDKKGYLYGSVKYDEGIYVDWTETIIPQGNAKHIHIDGEKISFKSFDDPEFTNKYADKITYEEEISEIEE